MSAIGPDWDFETVRAPLTTALELSERDTLGGAPAHPLFLFVGSMLALLTVTTTSVAMGLLEAHSSRQIRGVGRPNACSGRLLAQHGRRTWWCVIAPRRLVDSGQSAMTGCRDDALMQAQIAGDDGDLPGAICRPLRKRWNSARVFTE